MSFDWSKCECKYSIKKKWPKKAKTKTQAVPKQRRLQLLFTQIFTIYVRIGQGLFYVNETCACDVMILLAKVRRFVSLSG